MLAWWLSMKINKTAFADLFICESDLIADKRGYHVTRFDKELFQSIGINTSFASQYLIRSTACVVRGLYYHNSNFNGLLISVSRGNAWLAAIDLRSNSKTYRKTFSCDLSENNSVSVWIPPGFAYGYCIPGFKTTDVLIDTTCSIQNNTTVINWNDPELAIPWPVDAKEAILIHEEENAQDFSLFLSESHPFRQNALV